MRKLDSFVHKALVAVLVGMIAFLMMFIVAEAVYVGDATARPMTVVYVDKTANLTAVSDGTQIYSYRIGQDQLSVGDSLNLVGIASGHAYTPEQWDKAYDILTTGIIIAIGIPLVLYIGLYATTIVRRVRRGSNATTQESN